MPDMIQIPVRPGLTQSRKFRRACIRWARRTGASRLAVIPSQDRVEIPATMEKHFIKSLIRFL